MIIDASKHFVKEGKNNKLRSSDIKRIADVVANREDNAGFSKVVDKQTVRGNSYNLNIPRYVDSSAAPESWDLHATMLGGIPKSEISNLEEYWLAFPQLSSALFIAKSEAYSELAIAKDELNATISQHHQVKAFFETYKQAFESHEDWLNTTLIQSWKSINRNQQESELSSDIFKRLELIALIDKYQAYQYLNDQWQIISADLEMMQTEGFTATKRS